MSILAHQNRYAYLTDKFFEDKTSFDDLWEKTRGRLLKDRANIGKIRRLHKDRDRVIAWELVKRKIENESVDKGGKHPKVKLEILIKEFNRLFPEYKI
jgi:hypothetical protein